MGMMHAFSGSKGNGDWFFGVKLTEDYCFGRNILLFFQPSEGKSNL